MAELAYKQDKGQYHIHLKKGDVGRYVILPGDPGRCELIARYFENPKFISQNREYRTYTGTIDNVPVSVVSTGIGGASASIAMEELIHVGADTFIRVGTAGGIRKDILGGDLIEWPAVPDFSVAEALKNAAEGLGLRYHMGVVQCKDSFYGQHDPDSMPVSAELKYKWEAWKRLGATCSEMESAALFTVAAARGVRCGSVMLVVANQTRRELGLEDSQVYDTDLAIRAAIEAIRLIIKKDAVLI